MLNGIPKNVSPDLLKVLMEMGHGDEIVLSDGNYPATSSGNLLVRCVSAYCIGYFTPIGGAAAWVSLPFGWVFGLTASACRYRFGPWRKKAVVTAAETLPGEILEEDGEELP